MDFLDADPTWSLVFRDDAAALYVRRDGPLRPLAVRYGYAVVPAGQEGLTALTKACWGDTLIRHRARTELERMVASSSWNAGAHSMLATLAWFDGDRSRARSHLENALAVDPNVRDAHRGLGHIAMTEGRWRDAIRELRSESTLTGARDLDFVLAVAYQRSGDVRNARSHYRRALALDPANQTARESLRVLGESPE